MAGWRCLTSPTPRSPAMTVAQAKLSVAAAKELLKGDPDGRREVVRAVLQEVPEAEMTDALGAAKGERSAGRLGYRSGHYGRTLITRVGKLELRVPQDPGRALLDRAVRAPPAVRAGARGGPGRDGSLPSGRRSRTGGPGRLDAEGEGGHRGAVRARLLRLGHLLDRQAPRRGARRLRPAAARGAVRLPGPRRPLREGARGRHRRQPGGAGRGRDRPGGTAPGGRGRAGEPGEPLVVEGRPARAEGAGPARRGVRGRGRPRRAQGGVARGAARRLRPALLRPLPEERAGPPAARGRRRLPAGAALDLRPARAGRGQGRSRRLAQEVGRPLRQADELGGGEHRGDLHLLSSAPPAPQAHEVDEHAGALERGDQATDARRAHLPERGELPATGARAGRRGPRELAGSEPLPVHGRPQGAEEAPAPRGRLTQPAGSRVTALLQNLTHQTPPAASAAPPVRANRLSERILSGRSAAILAPAFRPADPAHTP